MLNTHGGIIALLYGNISVNSKNNYYLQGQPNYTGIGTAKTENEIKELASTLGAAFIEDTNNINNGYPILAWQVEATE